MQHKRKVGRNEGRKDDRTPEKRSASISHISPILIFETSDTLQMSLPIVLTRKVCHPFLMGKGFASPIGGRVVPSETLRGRR
jgi:hypothetical protein